MEYRDDKGRRRAERRFSAAAQQQTPANQPALFTKDLSPFYGIVLTQTFSHTSPYYWSWMAACTSWNLSLTLSLLIMYHPAVVPMKSPSSFQINVSTPSHLRVMKQF